jgi:hypothetical protein
MSLSRNFDVIEKCKFSAEHAFVLDSWVNTITISKAIKKFIMMKNYTVGFY